MLTTTCDLYDTRCANNVLS